MFLNDLYYFCIDLVSKSLQLDLAVNIYDYKLALIRMFSADLVLYRLQKRRISTKPVLLVVVFDLNVYWSVCADY